MDRYKESSNIRSFAVVLLFHLVALLSCTSPSKSQDSRPTLHRVNDHANVLTALEEDSLVYLTRGLEEEIGSQIVITTLDTLSEDLATWSLRKVNEWGIGRSGVNDGVLITVVMQKRTMRIEVGTGLEKIISIEIADAINKEVIAPKFIEEKYYEGLRDGVLAISKLIRDNQSLIGK